MRAIIILIFLILLAGCASVSEVSSIGTDTYTVASSRAETILHGQR